MTYLQWLLEVLLPIFGLPGDLSAIQIYLPFTEGTSQSLQEVCNGFLGVLIGCGGVWLIFGLPVVCLSIFFIRKAKKGGK